MIHDFLHGDATKAMEGFSEIYLNSKLHIPIRITSVLAVLQTASITSIAQRTYNHRNKTSNLALQTTERSV